MGQVPRRAFLRRVAQEVGETQRRRVGSCRCHAECREAVEGFERLREAVCALWGGVCFSLLGLDGWFV